VEAKKSENVDLNNLVHNKERETEILSEFSRFLNDRKLADMGIKQNFKKFYEKWLKNKNFAFFKFS
jgi:hypothetical protein